MSLNEISLKIPNEHIRNVFGQFDEYMKTIERNCNVTVVVRDGQMKLLGEPSAIEHAKNVFEQLLTLSQRGNVITAQNVKADEKFIVLPGGMLYNSYIGGLPAAV